MFIKPGPQIEIKVFLRKRTGVSASEFHCMGENKSQFYFAFGGLNHPWLWPASHHLEPLPHCHVLMGLASFKKYTK